MNECQFCYIPLSDLTYRFCSIECQSDHWRLIEMFIKELKVDKELFISWQNAELASINDIITNLSNDDAVKEIQKRIEDLARLEYECKAKSSALYRLQEEKLGRKGIPTSIKESRPEIDVTFNVNFDKPKKEVKVKASKESVFATLGIDVKAMLAAIEAKKSEK